MQDGGIHHSCISVSRGIQTRILSIIQRTRTTMSNLKEIICNISPMSDATANAIASCAVVKSLKKRELLIKEGTVNSDFFFVRKGMLRAFHVHDGKEDTIWFAFPGNACCEMHCMHKMMPAIFGVEALTDTEVYCISRDSLLKLCQQSHEMSEWMRKLSFFQLYLLERRYSFIGSGDSYHRFKAFMRMIPMEMIQQIPLKIISSYLGITPQTLSNMRQRYGKDDE
jgi:CRP-like cAMP-binding protein